MRILVQKFGGSSLTTKQSREQVISHITREYNNGYAVVVVVSAMGRLGEPYATDTLLELVYSEKEPLSSRERDLLLCCGETISAVTLCAMLQERGLPAHVYTGAGAGIITDEQFGNAKILEIRPKALIASLEAGAIVIVTGFQGVSEAGELTTLGRGGSDTSATALGAALTAEIVDIYTDVVGVLTADPRIVTGAKPLSAVSYAEICNLAREGAKVIHPRAVEIAQQARLPIRIRSTFSEDTGTWIGDQAYTGSEQMLYDRHVTGIAHYSGLTQITVKSTNQFTDMPLSVFKTMADHQISVDFIHVTPNKVTYTIFDKDAAKAIKQLRTIGYEPEERKGCAKVSIIGGGMNGQPGVMAKIVEALSEKNIAIMQSADSNTTIWVLVHDTEMEEAVRTLHNKFELHK